MIGNVSHAPATAVAMLADKGMVMARKAGKLPGDVVSESYKFEYGEGTYEVNKDIINNKRVIVVDDLIATGGSLKCVCDLCKKANASVVGIYTLIELSKFDGKKQLEGYSVNSIFKM